jgi:hypothetical protein
MSSSPFSLFPTSTTAPCAFGLFGQDPRDAHGRYEELAAVLGRPSSHGRAAPRSEKRSASSNGSNSFVENLRRFFGNL